MPGAEGWAAGLPARSRRALLLLTVAFVLLSVTSAAATSVTIDEPLHLHYGLFLLQGNSDRIDDSSMPVAALNALPLYLSSRLPDGPLKSAFERIFMARLVTIMFGALFMTIIFRWAHSLYGAGAASLTAILYTLDPNVLANAQLVTTDVLAAGMMTWSLFLTWRFAESRQGRDAVIAATVIGLSQLVKYTAITLFPLCAVLVLVHDWPALRRMIAEHGSLALLRYTGRALGFLLAAEVAVCGIINLGFIFNRAFTPIQDYRFRSAWFRSAQQRLGALAALPIPLPYPYVEGLDWMLRTDQAANRYGNIYLLGGLSKPDGFPGYYIIASGLKMPIATQLLIGVAVVTMLSDPRRRSRAWRNEAFLLLPSCILAIYLNFLFNAQTGMRYHLVVALPLYVLAGSLLAGPRAALARNRILILGSLGYLAVSVLSYFPHFTPYFNELVADKTKTYRYLADSNLEWGQSQAELGLYLARNPSAVYAPSTIRAGRLVVSGSDLVGVLESPYRYAWLRENFDPQDTIAYAYFIYVISPEEVAQLCSKTGYCVSQPSPGG